LYIADLKAAGVSKDKIIFLTQDIDPELLNPPTAAAPLRETDE